LNEKEGLEKVAQKGKKDWGANCPMLSIVII